MSTYISIRHRDFHLSYLIGFQSYISLPYLNRKAKIPFSYFLTNVKDGTRILFLIEEHYEQSALSNEPWALIFHISMRSGNVGTSACSVRGFHSRRSRQRLRAKFCEIRGIITLTFSSDAARNVPTSHCSSLTTHSSSPTVKHFYFCSSSLKWCQNEQKSLKIIQKQT